MSFPPPIDAHRDALVAASMRVPRLRALGPAAVTRALDPLIEWSLARERDLAFAPSGDLRQPAVAFARRGGDHLVWKAYPGGSDGEPKVELFPRGHEYLPPAVWTGLRERIFPRGDARLADGRVVAISLAGLARGRRLEEVTAALAWALDQNPG